MLYDPSPRSFYFIRHGQSVANAEHYPAGKLDSPLSDQGREEAEALRRDIDARRRLSPHPLRIITSTLTRARHTAAIINEALNLPMTEDENLCEQDYGAFQGQHKDMIKAAHGETWYLEPPGGESFAAFQSRIRAALQRILRPGEPPPLIVGHGGMIMALSIPPGQPVSNPRKVGNCAFLFIEGASKEGSDMWEISSLR